jgi:hypothetical protein
MSQRGSAPRPASRRRSNSTPPAEAATFSPPSPQPASQPGLTRGDDLQALRDVSGLVGRVVTEGEARPKSSETRASGVHDILNPSGTHPPYPGNIAHAPHQSVEEGSSGVGVGGRRPSGHGGSPTQPYAFQGQRTPVTTQALYPPLAPLSTPGSMNPGGQRGSPTIGPPLPPIGAPRRILAPMSPRAASLGRATLRATAGQPASLPPQSGLRGGPPSHYGSPRSGPALPGGLPQIQTLGQGLGLPPATSPGLRSLSHSIIGRTLPHAISTEHLPLTGGAPSLSSGPPRPPPFPPSLPAARDMLPGGQLNDIRWTGGLIGPGAARGWPRGLAVGEGQPIFAITPQSGEEIFVPVDTHQGSKSADERRLRNAGASQRFRSRKKEKETLMEEETRRLHGIVRGLEQQRDFYRNERNRLRDIVSRTPGISEWANGPPTPTATQGGASPEPESRPALNNPPPTTRRRTTQTRPYSYEPDETSSLEPPARRRRTEQRPNFRFASPSYEPQPIARSATLPAAHLHSHPHPLAVYSVADTPQHPGVARLPPLRLEHQTAVSEHTLQPQPQPGAGPGVPPPPLQAQTQHQPQPTIPYGRAPQETGWAVYPRGSQDGGGQR